MNAAFKPKQITRRFLHVLPPRARDVIVYRYGLSPNEGGDEGETLEAIGSRYGITRERVRQIENYALQSIKRSDVFQEEATALTDLMETIDAWGAIVAEDELLSLLAKDRRTQNHILLLLTLGDAFTRERETDVFRHRWFTDASLADAVHRALEKLAGDLSEDDLISEPEFIARFARLIDGMPPRFSASLDIHRRWLSLSKRIGANPLGEWGLAHSPNIRAKGMRDYAYLVIRRHGSPMHFTEVARAIGNLFGRPAHVATCHNELIKDARFVLVGRGLYALSEWGYIGGVVRDVIQEILKKHGPLGKREIIEKVLKERYVKENTITVNLDNASLFMKDASGRYSLVA